MTVQGKVEKIIHLRAFGLLDMLGFNMIFEAPFAVVHPSAQRLLLGELPVDLKESCEVHLVEFTAQLNSTNQATAWMKTNGLQPIGLEHLIGLATQFDNRWDHPIIASKLKQKGKAFFLHDTTEGDGGWRRRLCGSTSRGAFTKYYLYGATPRR